MASAMNISLHVVGCLDSLLSQRKIKIRDGDECGIGRASESRCVIARPDNAKFDNQVISRKHAVIRAKTINGKLTALIEDTTSMHGVFQNGKKLNKNDPCPLKDGDELQFGCTVLHDHITHQPIKCFVGIPNPNPSPTAAPNFKVPSSCSEADSDDYDLDASDEDVKFLIDADNQSDPTEDMSDPVSPQAKRYSSMLGDSNWDMLSEASEPESALSLGLPSLPSEDVKPQLPVEEQDALDLKHDLTRAAINELPASNGQSQISVEPRTSRISIENLVSSHTDGDALVNQPDQQTPALTLQNATNLLQSSDVWADQARENCSAPTPKKRKADEFEADLMDVQWVGPSEGAAATTPVASTVDTSNESGRESRIADEILAIHPRVNNDTMQPMPTAQSNSMASNRAQTTNELTHKRIKLQVVTHVAAGIAIGAVGMFVTLASLPESLFS